MSKSPRTPSRTAKIPRKRAAAPHPWVIDGINYGPAVAAVHELAAWAFDLAARDVADWPEGQRRVNYARGFVLDHLGGKRSRRTPYEDVMFCAALLARIFEVDLKLGMSEVVTILDQLGLPTEVVPLASPQTRARISVHPPAVPLQPRPGAPASHCGECGHTYPAIRTAA